MLLLRQEYFGYTLYDKSTLTHTYVSQEEGKSLLNTNKATLIDTTNKTFDKSSGLLVAPIRLYFEATKKCNLRCRHCFNASGYQSKDQLDSEKIIKILEWLKQDGLFDIRFTWGEFTQREGWFKILKAAKNLGFAVSLNTNGVYDNDNVLSQLDNLDLDQITISIDWWEDTHNNIRTGWSGSNFEKSIFSIRKLSEMGQRVRINTVLVEENINDVKKILDFASLYCDEINFFAMRHVGRATTDQMIWTSLSIDSFDEISKKIGIWKKDYPHMRILHWHQVMQQNSVSLENNWGLKSGSPDGLTRFNMLDNGDLYAGWYTPYIGKEKNLFKLGNVIDNEYSILKTWYDSKKLHWLRDMSSLLKEECKNCSRINNGCPGGIFEMELQKEYGDIINNPYCEQDLSFIDKSSFPNEN